MFGRRGHRLYFLNAGRESSRWLWIVHSLTTMIRKKRRDADPTEDPALEPTLKPVLDRALNSMEELVLKYGGVISAPLMKIKRCPFCCIVELQMWSMSKLVTQRWRRGMSLPTQTQIGM
ncbi:hypothetical protein FH972_000841 [Carpinus fangiana]|uniref:Uncharacterized protein n=1 Tax=Carpinus fangiana TaxID=176857 RepID=A0A5N6QD13_9ROSI|nr:hypothetical protein FH972_000841 [Carpinus fangiana]